MEFKTMTSLRTVKEEIRKGEEHETCIVLSDFGVDYNCTTVFHSPVPTTLCRVETQHQAAALSINSLLLVVASAQSMTEGRIIYSLISLIFWNYTAPVYICARLFEEHHIPVD